MSTWPEKWGFLNSLDQCHGKTIEKANQIKMPFGCTWQYAWAIRFTDGSRAFFVGGKGSGIMSPAAEAMEASDIFTPEEVAQVVAERVAENHRREREQEDKKRREFEKLKKELGL